MLVTFAQINKIGELLDELNELTNEITVLVAKKEEAQDKFDSLDVFETGERKQCKLAIKKIDRELNQFKKEKNEIIIKLARAAKIEKTGITSNSVFDFYANKWVNKKSGFHKDQQKTVDEMSEDELDKALKIQSNDEDEVSLIEADLAQDNKSIREALEKFQEALNPENDDDLSNSELGLKKEYWGLAVNPKNYLDINGHEIGLKLEKAAVFDSENDATAFASSNNLDHAKAVKFTGNQIFKLRSQNHVSGGDNIISGEINWDDVKKKTIYIILVDQGKYLSRDMEFTSDKKKVWAFTDKDYAEQIIEQAKNLNSEDWAIIPANSEFKKGLSWKDIDETKADAGIGQADAVKAALDKRNFKHSDKFVLVVQLPNTKPMYLAKGKVTRRIENALVFASANDANNYAKTVDKSNILIKLDNKDQKLSDIKDVKYSYWKVPAELESSLIQDNFIRSENIKKTAKVDIDEDDFESGFGEDYDDDNISTSSTSSVVDTRNEYTPRSNSSGLSRHFFKR